MGGQFMDLSALRTTISLRECITASGRVILSKDPVSLFSAWCEFMPKVIPCDWTSLFMRDGDKVFPSVVGGSESSRFSREPFSMDTGITGLVARQRLERVAMNNPETSRELGQLPHPSESRFTCAFPVFSGEIGNKYTVAAGRKDPGPFTALEISLFAASAELLGIALQRLTNTQTMEQQLEQALANQGTGRVAHRDSLNLHDLQQEAIVEALRRADGNMSLAARELGIGRGTLYRHCREINRQSEIPSDVNQD